MKSTKYYLQIIISFFLGALLFGSVQYALAQVQTSNIIHGCVRNPLGTLRIIGDGETCNTNETPLDWNSQGGGSGGIFANWCTGCNFQGNNIGNLLAGQDLTGYILSGSDFTEANLQNTNLSNTNLNGSSFTKANLQDANLSNALISRGGFTYATLTNTNFSGAQMQEVDIDTAQVQGANFSNANLSKSKLDTISTVQVNFLNADLSYVFFNQANLVGALNIETANLQGSVWANTTCPDGTNSNNNGNTCIGHLNP